MEYIQALFKLAQDYWFLSMIVGLFSTFIESFIPVLPLVAIVTINAALFGMGMGLVISWIGSSFGTIAVFLIVSKFNNSKFINKYKNDKVLKIIECVKSKGFKLLFIVYCCPFIPTCLVTVASAICKCEFKYFITAMLSGKFVMFMIISYIGRDINGFITNPIKILLFLIIVFIAWKISNKVNLSLENYEEDNLKVNDM